MKPVRVQATKTGFYDLRRYREGDEFEISKPEEFSPSWMQPREPFPADWEDAIARTSRRHESIRPRLEEMRGRLPPAPESRPSAKPPASASGRAAK
jgi:hypothetical protein